METKALLFSAAALVVGLAPEARADEEHVRVFGAGTALGAGVAAATASDGAVESDALGLALLLPTLELQAFLPDEYSIDISLPITNIAVVPIFTGWFAWTTDVYFNFNFGSGIARGIVGPGLGSSIIVSTKGDGAVGSFRVPAEVGLELNTVNEAFGFKVMARPWLEVGAGEVSGVGGGVLGVIGFSGYVRK